MPDYSKLKTELTTDPDKLGYAALKGGLTNHNELAAMLSSTTGPGSAAVAMASVSKNYFLAKTAAAAIRCKAGIGTDGAALPATIATAWYEAVVQARSADGAIDLTLVSALEAICGGDPVTVKVMTSAEYSALTTRAGNRAEVIGAFGPLTDSVQGVTPADLGTALMGVA